MTTQPAFVCLSCGQPTRQVDVSRGSSLVFIILLALCFVPGILYGLWLLTAEAKGCQHCKSTQIIPSNSPMGQKIIAEMNQR
jgi:hypothetical protein